VHQKALNGTECCVTINLLSLPLVCLRCSRAVFSNCGPQSVIRSWKPIQCAGVCVNEMCFLYMGYLTTPFRYGDAVTSDVRFCRWLENWKGFEGKRPLRCRFTIPRSAGSTTKNHEMLNIFCVAAEIWVKDHQTASGTLPLNVFRNEL
jgi:hypothetical protein